MADSGDPSDNSNRKRSMVSAETQCHTIGHYEV